MKARELRLSKRLQAVADMVTRGNVVCDVGCDHGFVPVYLVKNGVSLKVIAMDINKGPLEAAREHVGEYFLADYIETRLSDGLEALLPGEAETVVCAGMGGRLVIRILEEGREKLAGVEELILQPQSELQNVRAYLRQQGYVIADENIVLEDGKYYPIMRISLEGGCKKDDSEQDTGQQEAIPEEKLRLEDKYGPVLLQKAHPVLKAYLERETGIYGQILVNLRKSGKEQAARIQEITGKLEDAQAALSYFKD